MYFGSDFDKYAENLISKVKLDDFKARLLAIDYGKKRIGIAISDDLQKLALPLLVVARSNIKTDLKAIFDIIIKNNIKGLVIGNPISNKTANSLNINKSMQAVLSFSHLLLDFLKNNNVELPLLLYDERYSSVAAEKLIEFGLGKNNQDNISQERNNQKKIKTKNYKPNIDKIAASIFLQEVLDKLTKLQNNS